MALATTKSEMPGGTLHRDSDASAANTALTVSTPAGASRRLLLVTVNYSASVTKDVTVTLNSGKGSAYDNLLQTISLSPGTDGNWVPDGETCILPDDSIDAVAAAGGAGVTSAVTIYTVAQ